MPSTPITLEDDGIQITLPGQPPVMVGLDLLSLALGDVERKHAIPWGKLPEDERAKMLDAWAKDAAARGVQPDPIPSDDDEQVQLSVAFFVDLAKEFAAAGVVGCNATYAQKLRLLVIQRLDEGNGFSPTVSG